MIRTNRTVSVLAVALAVLIGVVVAVSRIGFVTRAAFPSLSSLSRNSDGTTTLAAYATRLQGRTPNQRRNALLAAQSLNGTIIPARGILSFNKTVSSWTMDNGYAKAPVSYDGELVPAYGGGVCQTSTTLYNAALLAGLQIVERHAHVFAPSYVPPGRDAAVAYPNIDLRVQNPHDVPLKVLARADGNRLEVRIVSAKRLPKPDVRVESRVLSCKEPMRRVVLLSQNDDDQRSHSRYMRNPGATGWRVVTYRSINGHSRHKIGDNTYPAMDRSVTLPVAP